MKRIPFFLVLILPFLLCSQSKKIQLSEAIKIAQKKSPQYVRAVNTYQSRYDWTRHCLNIPIILDELLMT